MAFRHVDAELHTGWDDAPTLTVVNRSDETTTLVLEFVTTPTDGTTPRRYSRVTFSTVWLYRWVATDIGYDPPDIDDYEFSLIEITDSPLVEEVFTKGSWQNEGQERDLRKLFGTDGIRHFRIGFDDHGTYDVLCATADVQHNSR